MPPVAAAAVAPPPALPTGDMARGQALFLGQQTLENGGTSCISCHSVGAHGTLGGGTLGPDLTRVAMTYGEDGLAASLVGLPFPTMQGIFNEHPLTKQEAADLHAFLVDQDMNGAPVAGTAAGAGFVIIGLVGSAVLMAISHLTWRKRQHTGIRQSLVDGK